MNSYGEHTHTQTQMCTEDTHTHSYTLLSDEDQSDDCVFSFTRLTLTHLSQLVQIYIITIAAVVVINAASVSTATHHPVNPLPPAAPTDGIKATRRVWNCSVWNLFQSLVLGLPRQSPSRGRRLPFHSPGVGTYLAVSHRCRFYAAMTAMVPLTSLSPSPQPWSMWFFESVSV